MRNIRISLVMITIILISIGIVMIYSSSSVYAWEKLGNSAYFLKRHLLYLVIGLITTLIIMSFDYRVLKKIVKPLLLVSFLLLVLVLIPGIGKEVAGARRWFRLFGFSFQPSELAKISLILYMADFLSRKEDKVKDFFGCFLPAMLVLGAFCLLVLAQPDLGTAIAMVVIIFLMLFVAGVRLTYLIMLILTSMPLFYILIFSVPYRRMRILAFLNPWNDPKGSGFQIIQSQLALGSGGLFGKGLGKSLQKLFYLPAAHTDFIFSIIGEELGLVGTAAIAILFILFIWQVARIAKNAVDSFGYYICVGIIVLIGFAAALNIAVSLGSLPTKGLPLPFISYGGSSLIFEMISVGLILNVSRCKEV